MELRRYWAVMLEWWWLILLGPLMTASMTFLISRSLTEEYQASTILRIRERQSSASANYSDLLLSERLAGTYAQLIKTRPILDEVSQSFDPPISENSLRAAIAVALIPNSQLLRITIIQSDPALARDIANRLAEVFIAQNRNGQLEELARLQSAMASRGLSNTQEIVSAQTIALDSLTVAEPATVPDSPVRPRVFLNTLLAALVGLIVALGLAFLLDYLDDTVKTPEDMEAIPLVALGTVMRFPRSNGQDTRRSLMINDRSHISEAYRVLRTNIQFASMDKQLSTLLVTSASPLEGKTTTAANLAVAFAQAGKRVIVVDTDLRRPALHHHFNLTNDQGITNLLMSDTTDVEPYLKPTEVENLRVLTTGVRPPNPAELLGSARMSAVINHLKAVADIVLFDSPPVFAVADSSILSSLLDGVVLVLDTNKTRTRALIRVKETLAKGKATILGGVLNKLSRGGRSGYGYYYYYYYHYYSEDGVKKRRTGKRRDKAKDKDVSKPLSS